MEYLGLAIGGLAAVSATVLLLLVYRAGKHNERLQQELDNANAALGAKEKYSKIEAKPRDLTSTTRDLRNGKF